MTAGPPVWLLDVDGVVNAASKEPDRSVWPADAWIRARVDGLKVLVAHPVVDFIRAVHESGRAEIRWHTTWREMTAQLAEVLNLPEFPVAVAPEYPPVRGDGWWKLPAAERVLLQERRPLVWTDDDLTWSLGRRGQDEMRGLGPVLFVAPDERVGLTPKHLRWIGDFLDLYPPASVPALSSDSGPTESEKA